MSLSWKTAFYSNKLKYKSIYSANAPGIGCTHVFNVFKATNCSFVAGEGSQYTNNLLIKEFNCDPPLEESKNA